MSARRRAFVDTNVFVYLLATGRKAELAERILDDDRVERVISTQVINEFVHVARTKAKVEWSEVREYLGMLRATCTVVGLTSAEQDVALDLAELYGFAWYDALIVSSALAAGVDSLLSEDFQNGMRVDNLRIANPFA